MGIRLNLDLYQVFLSIFTLLFVEDFIVLTFELVLLIENDIPKNFIVDIFNDETIFLVNQAI